VVLLVVAETLVGALVAINTRVLVGLQAVGRAGYGVHVWRKPCFLQIGTSIGMTLALFVHKIRLNYKNAPPYFLESSMGLSIIGAAFFGVLGSILLLLSSFATSPGLTLTSYIAGVMVAMAIWRFQQGRDLLPNHFTGVFLAMISFSLISFSSFLAMRQFPSATNTNGIATLIMLAGAALEGSSSVVFALRFLVEETLTQDRGVPPLLVVGFEGVARLFFCVFLFIPGSHFLPSEGWNEDFVDSLLMLGNKRIFLFFLLHILLASIWMILGAFLSEKTNFLSRVMCQPAKIVAAGIIELGIAMRVEDTEHEELFLGFKGYGGWVNWAFVGYGVLIFGVLVFSGVVKLKIPNLEKHIFDSESSDI
jgi:hypothetical protein